MCEKGGGEEGKEGGGREERMRDLPNLHATYADIRRESVVISLLCRIPVAL